MSPAAAATSAGAENRAAVVPVVPENTDPAFVADALCRRTVWL